MNPAPALADGRLAYKDAVFISPHKFVGGPGTPGVLVAKRALLRNRVPAVPGGGTVLYVTPSRHAYHSTPEIREEGGTPGIVESIRAGLVFALKDAVGSDEIRRREHTLARRAVDSWGTNRRIEILGNTSSDRLAIISFGLRHRGGLLHANFVAAVLSDLFGIQARSGCFCAGPYLHRVYNIDDGWSDGMVDEIIRGHEGVKLAFTRITLSYHMSETVLEYILDAVHFIAAHGWKLLPLYRFDPCSGIWRHHAARRDVPVGLHAALGRPPTRLAAAPESALASQLRQARAIVAAIERHPPTVAVEDPELTEEFERVRWFPLPSEVTGQLRGGRRRNRTSRRSRWSSGSVSASLV
jgi:hypothetical protein